MKIKGRNKASTNGERKEKKTKKREKKEEGGGGSGGGGRATRVCATSLSGLTLNRISCPSSAWLPSPCTWELNDLLEFSEHEWQRRNTIGRRHTGIAISLRRRLRCKVFFLAFSRAFKSAWLGQVRVAKGVLDESLIERTVLWDRSMRRIGSFFLHR